MIGGSSEYRSPHLRACGRSRAGHGPEPVVASATAPPTPGLAEIGQQFVDETGATNVACSQYDADFICYGLVDDVLVAGVYSGGQFTPYAGPVAPTTTMAAATAAPTSTVPGATLVWTGTPNTTLEQPVFEADGITSRIDMIALVNPVAGGQLGHSARRRSTSGWTTWTRMLPTSASTWGGRSMSLPTSRTTRAASARRHADARGHARSTKRSSRAGCRERSTGPSASTTQAARRGPR